MKLNIKFPFIFVSRKRLEGMLEYNLYAHNQLAKLRTRIVCLEEENKNLRYNYEHVKTLLKEQQNITKEQSKTIHIQSRKLKKYDTTRRS